MSIDSPVFHLVPDTDLPSNQITSELNNLRTIVTCSFYKSLNDNQKQFFHNFLWETLFGLSKHQAPAVRLAASSVQGHILLRLAPFYYTDFMNSLCDTIRKTGELAYMYLTSFCYLSKFMSPATLDKYLYETPIIDLFSKASSEHLPNLIQEIRHFPNSFLKLVTEQFIKISLENPNNRHLPKAAAAIISRNVQEYASVITEEMPLQLITALFPDKLPTLSPDIANIVGKNALDVILSDSPLPTKYEAACRVLFQLINSKQFDEEIVRSSITKEVILKSKNMMALFALPIDKERIKELYLLPKPNFANSQNQSIAENKINEANIGNKEDSQINDNSETNLSIDSKDNESNESNFENKVSEDNTKTCSNENNEKSDKDDTEDNNKIISNTNEHQSPNQKNDLNIISTKEIDKNLINPLMIYFSKNMDFMDQLINMISEHLTPESDSYSVALKILGDVSTILPKNILNDLLIQAFLINTPNWIHKLWTLELISKLNFFSLSTKASKHAFEVIKVSATSKTEKLNQTAKEVTVKIFDSCHLDIFKLFIDKFVRELDVFDQENFELRISYLSYIFKNTPSHWTISFVHIANALIEAVSLFDFSSTVMMDIFSIIGVLAQNLKENFALLLFFTSRGLDIIEPSFAEFCGSRINKERPQLFFSPSQPKTNQKGEIVSNVSQLNRVDTDLTSNPGAWHTHILHSAEAAFSMIVMVPWSNLEMKSDDVYYLYHIANKLLYLFPSESNQLITMLMDHSILKTKHIKKFISSSLKVSKYGESVLNLARIMAICVEKNEEIKKRLRNNQLMNNNNFDEKHERHQILKFNFSKDDILDYIKSIKMMIPLYHDLEYAHVISLKEVLHLAKYELPDEDALRIIKKSERYFLTDQIEANEESNNENIIDTHTLYAMSDDDNDNKEESNAITSAPSDQLGLLLYCQSLSPFFSVHREIPKELLQPVILKSFFDFSKVQMNKNEADFLLKHIIELSNINILASYLKYIITNKINIDIKPYIGLPQFQSKSILLYSATILKINKLPNDYVSKVMKDVDLVQYVLNASTTFQRRVSKVLLRIDTNYFCQQFKEIKKFKYSQIYNLCLYVNHIKFPSEAFFIFIVSLISNNCESRKKKNIVRRLLTIFVYSKISNKQIVEQALQLLICDIGPAKNIDSVRKQNEAQLLELFYEAFILRYTVDCNSILETLALALTKSTYHGQLLITFLLKPHMNLETINNYFSHILPSIQSLPFKYYADQYSMLNNINPNVEKTIHPQAIEAMLSMTFVKNSNLASILFPFAHLLTIFKTNKYLNTKEAIRGIFKFINNNFTFSPYSFHTPYFLQFYYYYLFKIKNNNPDFDIIKTNVASLFERDIVSKQSVDLLWIISGMMKDQTFYRGIIGNYLKQYDSYQMFEIAETAVKYTLQSQKKADDIANVFLFAKSFFATFNAFVFIQKQNKDISHKFLIGLFSPRHERAITLFSNRSLRPFSIYYALMGDDKDPPPSKLEEYIKTLSNESLLGFTGTKYNVF